MKSVFTVKDNTAPPSAIRDGEEDIEAMKMLDKM